MNFTCSLIGVSALVASSAAGAQDIAVEAPFTKIYVEGDFNVVVSQGEGWTLSASSLEHMNSFTIESRGDWLHIEHNGGRFPQNFFRKWRSLDLTFTITAPKIDAIDASRGADVTIPELDASKMWLGAHTDSTIFVQGTCEEAALSVHTFSKIDAGEFVCAGATVIAHTSADVVVNARESFEGDAHTNAEIFVRGQPADRSYSSHTGGRVRFVTDR